MLKIVKLLVRKISEHPQKNIPDVLVGTIVACRTFFLVFFIFMSFCTIFIEFYTVLHNLCSHISIANYIYPQYIQYFVIWSFPTKNYVYDILQLVCLL